MTDSCRHCGHQIFTADGATKWWHLPRDIGPDSGVWTKSRFAKGQRWHCYGRDGTVAQP